MKHHQLDTTVLTVVAPKKACLVVGRFKRLKSIFAPTVVVGNSGYSEALPVYFVALLRHVHDSIDFLVELLETP